MRSTNLYNFMKRIFDIFISFTFIMIFILPMFIISLLIILFDGHNPIYFSKRIGKDNSIFLMPKFRTMKKNTPQVATHLFHNHNSITKFGRYLRKSSLDELPQLFSILFGFMSIVGPRPALFNQYDLIKLRKAKKIDKVLPGLTGLAQIKGRDINTIAKKVELDHEYINKRSFLFDLIIIYKTFFIVLLPNNIKH